MYRDPLDELIEDLERMIPAKAAKPAFDPADFQWEAEILDRQPATTLPVVEGEVQPPREEPRSTIATAPAVWPVRPARRRDPSAPILGRSRRHS